MRDMSLGHIDTFTFCIKTPRMSWRLGGDWLYLHVPETRINSSSLDAWYVPVTYRHMAPEHQLVPVHSMREMSLGHVDSLTFCINPPVCHGALIETDYISMSPGHELVPVRGMRDMILGHLYIFTFCIKNPTYVMALVGDWLHFHVTGHESVAVPGMRDMSLGHSDTFTLWIRNPRILWRLDGDWK